jgi:hypothetical protein
LKKSSQYSLSDKFETLIPLCRLANAPRQRKAVSEFIFVKDRKTSSRPAHDIDVFPFARFQIYETRNRLKPSYTYGCRFEPVYPQSSRQTRTGAHADGLVSCHVHGAAMLTIVYETPAGIITGDVTVIRQGSDLDIR